MRTTIDVPVHIRQRLSQEASSRNLKGFSTIIVEALETYFDAHGNGRQGVVARLKGSMSLPEHAKAMKEIKAGRAQWRM